MIVWKVFPTNDPKDFCACTSLDDALEMAKEGLEGSDTDDIDSRLEDSMTIEVSEMTQEEYNKIPDFQGW